VTTGLEESPLKKSLKIAKQPQADFPMISTKALGVVPLRFLEVRMRPAGAGTTSRRIIKGWGAVPFGR
jgi:hypothetical protein